MSGSGYVGELGERLSELKSRTELSYAALARRTGVSASALHRYCSGVSVPSGYETVCRFGKACGADSEELLELHRLWVLAAEDRRTAARLSATRPYPGGEARDSGSAPAAGPEPVPYGEEVPYQEDTEHEPAADSPARESALPEETPVLPGPGNLAAPGEEAAVSPRSWWPTAVLSTLALLACVLGVAMLLGMAGPSADDRERSSDDRLLLSSACPVVIGMGQNDDCVRELQILLARAGGNLDIDGTFGPVTQTRVIAFQISAGLKPNGVVDEHTKRALYTRKVRLRTWSPTRVEKRIRQVFKETPHRAVGIARCQSSLDPLWSLPNTNGSRNWGVFQLSDATLQLLDGTREEALSPEWNIQAAHRLWEVTGDFRAWACGQAYRTASPAPSAHPSEQPPDASGIPSPDR